MSKLTYADSRKYEALQ
jgi:dynein heavy chain 2, cytosolic